MARFLLFPLLLITLLWAGTPTPPAHALSNSDLPDHCVTDGAALFVCFDTLTESLAYASDGQLVVAADTPATAITTADLMPSGILALLYDANNQTGYSLAIVGDRCGVGSNMPAVWNNRVSSGQTGSCGIYLYDGYNLTGNNVFISAPGTNYVGDTLNNRTSSWNIP